MADPVKLVYSLEHLSQHYTVFEPDQVLTHGQLNSVADYFDDQGRLTRVDGLGVGIASGLRVGLRGAAVHLARGLGITTDGDWLRLPQDSLYTHGRPYDSSAPVYEPFWRRASDGDGAATMMAITELLPSDGEDPRARPLAELEGGLAGKVVVLLMESVVHDTDLCTGTGCDNLGRDAQHRVRVLLLDAADAQDLAARAAPLLPASARAAGLPEALAERPVLARDIATTGALAERMRAAGRGTVKRLLVAIDALARRFPELLDELFGADPSAEWLAILQRRAADFDSASTGLTLWLAHLKDLVDSANTVRDALLADDTVPLPDARAFPKHLLLGRVDDRPAPLAAVAWRTGFFPSPVQRGANGPAARVRFALWRLHVLVHSFALPDDTLLRITPSQGEDRPLDERAIPWYYRVDAALPVHSAWSQRLATRREPQANLGYRAAQWGGSERALSPLAFGLAGHGFFRIEGHLGRPVKTVTDELQAQIAAHNLPIQVQAVLLHKDRKRIVVKPGIRYTDLHRLHHLVRSDVALRVEEGAALGERLLGDVTQAVADRQIDAAGGSGESAVGIAVNARDALGRVKAQSAASLASPRYSAYRADTGWKATLASSAETVGQARVSLGHVARTDFTSAFDSLIATNQPHWIDWLDVLIQAGDERADEKLLFPQFVQQHPGWTAWAAAGAAAPSSWSMTTPARWWPTSPCPMPVPSSTSPNPPNRHCRAGPSVPPRWWTRPCAWCDRSLASASPGRPSPSSSFRPAADGHSSAPANGRSWPVTTASIRQGLQAATMSGRNVPTLTQVPLSSLKSSVTRPSNTRPGPGRLHRRSGRRRRACRSPRHQRRRRCARGRAGSRWSPWGLAPAPPACCRWAPA